MAKPVCARMRHASLASSFTLGVFFAGGAATAQETPASEEGLSLNAGGAATAQETPASEEGLSLNLDVVAKQLDIARSNIQPSLGASVYDFGREAIETQPQGDNQPLNRQLLQAPGVT